MVSADTLRTVVGIIGNVIALGLFFSPLPTFIRIWKKKSVEEFSVIPYVATLLNCMLWMLYGLPIVHPNSTLVLTINCAGTAIEICYVILYLVFSNGPKRVKALLLFLGDLAFVAVVAIIVLIFFHTHDRRSLIVGILCVIFCIIMYLAPLSVMKMVIQTKSVEYMPLSLSVASFLNGLCWTIYALIRFDLYITIPNVLGLLFSITQLVLQALYYKSTKRQIAERKLKGEVGLTDVVIDDSVKFVLELDNSRMVSGLQSAFNNRLDLMNGVGGKNIQKNRRRDG
ncbi:bidirectional sugar transporter SWEET4-like [Dendrobium catenatum]|uniref:bidirectional sugar transporter SWEET4-like n=1 Tax=Dendrobium catenatum TaxID=906689 RepID=UPI0010A015E4|nr:bidirectional sugar transporter SWEET4-like [Dendrobium catenatum]